MISKTLTMLVAPEPLVNRFKETNNAIAQIRTQSLLSASSPEDMHTLLERGQHLALMIENLVGFVYEDLAKIPSAAENILHISEQALEHLAENFPHLAKLADKLGYGGGVSEHINC